MELEEKTEEANVHPYDPPFLFGALGRTRAPGNEAGAWGFFAALHSRRGIPLSVKSAEWTSENPQIVDWITTVIATILAFFTTSLFSSGILKCITLHLHGDGMSLAAFIASTKISAGSLILDRDPRRWRVGFLSIVIFFLTGGVQTAGWKALITPYPIDAHAPLTGTEIDLSKPVLSQLQSNGRLDYCVKSGTSGPEFILGQTGSGYAAAKNSLGLPATFTMMDNTFNLSTAGIMPLSPDIRNAEPWFAGSSDFLPNLQWGTDIPSGLSYWSSITQQGFTADVFCDSWDPKDTTLPTILVGNTTVKDWNNSENLIDNITFSELRSDCQVDDKVALTNWSRAYTVESAPNYLLMIACPSKDNYKLIFNAHPEGPYNFLNTTVCTLTPKITTVEVTYTDVINTVTSQSATLADPSGPATLAAVRTLYNGVFSSQSPVSNGVGDTLRSLMPTQGGNNNTRHLATMDIMEYYIRGVTEYSASAFRACLWANQTFTDTFPSGMNVPVEGVVHSDTVGWLQASPVTLLELIPGLLISIFTIYAIIITLAYNSVDPRNEPFDPSDPLHLMAASAAGYLHNVFTGTRAENLMAVEEANVFLRDIEGRGPGLIRSD
ncbi:hypothetical protein MVEN_00654500 [Mycena venus]|uniref:Uncharacterized protein n=1 Tax=Mycena venus TaxID=2733690 RepID=A0A8H7D863_9AGAR|nr:hypothetical protein MVEN_00654500 [Mycena venus]